MEIESPIVSEIAETEELLSKATFPGIKTALTIHLNKLRKIEESEKAAVAKSISSSAIQTQSETKPKFSPNAVFVPIESFAWDQGEYNSPTVSIFIDLDNVGTVKDAVEVNFTKASFDVKVMNLQGKNYRLIKENLDKDIIPDKSSFLVKKNKIVLKLQKVKGEYSYEHWTALTAKKKREEADKKADPMGGKRSYYPFACLSAF